MEREEHSQIGKAEPSNETATLTYKMKASTGYECTGEQHGISPEHWGRICAAIANTALPSQPAGKAVQAIHLGFDYLDNGQLVATYAVPVASQTAPKLYTSATVQVPDALELEVFSNSNDEGYVFGWNACREEMLSSAPQPKGGEA